jgi:hypothetical protein
LRIPTCSRHDPDVPARDDFAYPLNLPE